MKTSIEIEDMNCASCASSIETRLEEKSGVISATVNYATNKAVVEHDKTITEKEIRNTIIETGYTPKSKDSTSHKETTGRQRKAVLSWVATLPVLLLMVLDWSPQQLLSSSVLSVLLFLFALPVVMYFGWKTHVSAVKGLKNKTFNMDSLISLGTLAALSTGVLMYLIPIDNYSGLAAMIMASHNVGKYVEHRAKGKASTAINDLMKLQPNNAVRKTKKGKETVPIDKVCVGDVVIVKPGEKIPVDGVIVEGKTTVNESMVTGESKPVKKKKGDDVIGSTLNGNGYIEVDVTRIGNDTFFSQIVDLIQNAQSDKLPIQKLADDITHYFVPTVLVISLLTFIFWYALSDVLQPVVMTVSSFLPWTIPTSSALNIALFASISVLVIACPCALGLATPTAIMAGTGRAAKKGILFSRGESIQILTNIDTVLFDKTGTVTKGEPEVTHIYTGKEYTQKEVLRYAASVESKSEHTLAQAITERAEKENTTLEPVKDFEAVTGKGIRGKIGKNTIGVGNSSLHKKNKISKYLKYKRKSLESMGHTAVYVSLDTVVIGVIGIADDIKEGVGDVVTFLQQNGKNVWMVTGDNTKTAKSIAERVGIDNVKAEVLPEEKIALVRVFQQEEKTVCMIGDGINDAPALKQSNVSIAMGTGTDIAIEASDINITNGDIQNVKEVFETSRITFKTIKQNLYWASGYNIIAIPLASMALLHPLIAIGAMFISSISVLLNSARIQ